MGFLIFKPALAAKAFETRVTKTFAENPLDGVPDGLHVYMCGAGSPLPDPKRSGPCMGVLAGDQAFIFDTGSGGNKRLALMGFPLGAVDEIFLTHLHSDHIDGLGEMLMQVWVNGGRSAPVPVAGPIGTQQVVDGFNAAYTLDSGYRVAHHGTQTIHPDGAGGAPVEIAMPGDSDVVYQKGDVKITAYRVSHKPISPAFGYRIDYKDRAVSISGDTVYDPNVAANSKDVDILFHEALNMEMTGAMRDAAKAAGRDRVSKIFGDILDYHTSPVDAAKTAKAAKAKALVLYHIVPMLPSDSLIPVFLRGTSSEFDGKISVSQDGQIYRLPAGRKEIIYEDGL